MRCLSFVAKYSGFSVSGLFLMHLIVLVPIEDYMCILCFVIVTFTSYVI